MVRFRGLRDMFKVRLRVRNMVKFRVSRYV